MLQEHQLWLHTQRNSAYMFQVVLWRTCWDSCSLASLYSCTIFRERTLLSSKPSLNSMTSATRALHATVSSTLQCYTSIICLHSWVALLPAFR